MISCCATYSYIPLVHSEPLTGQAAKMLPVAVLIYVASSSILPGLPAWGLHLLEC